jgi:hypothetical protein
MKPYFYHIFVVMILGGCALAVDREAFTVTRYKLDVQIDRASHVMAVTGRLTLRNDSKLPQKNVVLQVSSSLSWNGIALDNKPVEWIGDVYTSDIDHTGALSEVIVTLPKNVPPADTISLDVQYGGTVTADATRITRMDAPSELALRNDWDQISQSFTAVRGLGYVVWYPVSLPAVSMSEGNTVFDAIDEWKAHHQTSQFDARIHVLSENRKLCIAGDATSASCGEASETSDPRTGGVTTQISNNIHLTSMGSAVPAFAVADYVQLGRPDITIFHSPDKTSIARDYAAAAEANDPVLSEWLSPPSRPAVVIELADPNANPYQSGHVLFTPLRQSDTSTVGLLLMPAQVAARFPSPRRWIEDGLQRFLQAISVERRTGRNGALRFLNEYLPPIVKAEEPIDQPGSAPKEPQTSASDTTLIKTSDEILLRGKGSFVFWMLRDMVGDAALQHALAAYRPTADISPAYFQGLLEDGRKYDVEWFFDDWVYRDRGLPEFRIENVYARPELESPNKLTLVTVTVENRGGAAAEVPVLVQTASGEKTVRVRVPAHQKASARAQTPGAPTKAVVNDSSVPEADSSDNTFEVTAAPEKY